MWNELWEGHKGKLIGAGSGIFFGFIYLFFGFWNMLVFAWLVWVGYYVGLRLDRKESILPVGGLLRWISERWQLFK